MKKFIYDGIVTGENFCERPQDIARLISYIEDSTNVLLIAKRRMGKSSLVKEVFQNHINTEKIVTIYADIYDITDEYDLAKELYRAVALSIKSEISSFVKTLKELFQRATFEITVGPDGTPSFSPKLATKDHDILLSDVFDGLKTYLDQNNLKAAFCIDEFQQIKKIKKPLDATIRKHIQHHNNISYIFTGSKRNTLSMLFKGEKSPLMGMVTPMELGPIPKDTFYKFSKKRISALSESIFDQIYDLAHSETKLIQHLLRNFAMHDGESLENTLESVLVELDAIARTIFESLSANSKKVIKILAINNQVEGLMSKEVLTENNISKSSLKAALDYLIKEDIIFLDNNCYHLDGGIGASFALWCSKRL